MLCTALTLLSEDGSLSIFHWYFLEGVMRPWLSGMTVGQVMPWPLATPRVPALTLAVHRLTACSVCEDYALQKDMTIKYD